MCFSCVLSLGLQETWIWKRPHPGTSGTRWHCWVTQERGAPIPSPCAAVPFLQPFGDCSQNMCGNHTFSAFIFLTSLPLLEMWQMLSNNPCQAERECGALSSLHKPSSFKRGVSEQPFLFQEHLFASKILHPERIRGWGTDWVTFNSPPTCMQAKSPLDGNFFTG